MAPASPAPFDEATLLAEAEARAGASASPSTSASDSASTSPSASDWGDASFRTPLRELLAAYAEAPLNGVGVAVLRTAVRRSLVQRLRAERWIARHPEIAREEVRAPWVVVGMMRSGTTLVQRLLARDPRTHCALGWEIGEPVPREGTRWDAPDPRIADGLARVQQMRDFAPQLYAIHPVDALEADEEIVFLADAFLSHVPEASCHVPRYRAWIDGQDFTPAYRYLKRMLQLLQWQKRQRGEVRERWVLKTPAHLGYLDTLLSVFPDARIVHLHRDPVATVTSGASLNFTLWSLYADAPDPAEVGRQWLERMAWAARRARDARRASPALDARVVDVDYRRAVADPLGEIERIYEAFDTPLEPEARRAMEAWLAADREAKPPPHRYTPEQFGLDERTIRDAFRDCPSPFDP